jgi:tRNA(Ile)-lysidine synthase
MTRLAERVGETLHGLGVDADAPVGVACSGGADSIALVHVLAGRRNLTLLHVDHRMRPDSSSDADFVRDTASALGLPSDVRTLADVPRDEAAARDARYQTLADAARERGLRFVLTAHTSDDQAETVLLRLMRGDTLDAIAPVRGIFVRPLLDVTRAELRAWLVANDSAWREDPTNTDTRFERNWVRHVLLPQLHERRPGVADVLARTAGRARDDALALDAIAAGIVAAAPSDDVGIFVPDVGRFPSAVLSRVIRVACRRLQHDPSGREVDAIRTMSAHVRAGEIDVWRLDDGLAFTVVPFPVPDPVAVPRDGLLESAAWGVSIRTEPGSRLRLRSRLSGDRVRTRAGTRKVQDVLVDAKVPRGLRPLVPILADDDGALAVVTGHLQSAPVMGAEPFRQTWSRAKVWGSAWIS